MTVPSYAAPGYPGPRPRPTVVTVATYLLYLVAALEVINAIVALSTYGPLSDAVKEVYAGTDAEGGEVFVTISLVIGAVINILIAAGFAILSIFDSRGKNAARIVTWVVGGIALCCVGIGLGSTAVTSSLGGDGTTTGGPSQAEVQERIKAALPSWYTPVNTTVAVVALLAILATIILLALPASNAFFRKPAAGGWDATLPYPGYPGGPNPGQPGQSPYPGQGQYPGTPYPGQPQQPGQPYPAQPYPGQPQYPGQQQYPGQPQHPGQPQYPGQPGQPSQYGQPGQPAPGLPPYPGQPSSPTPPPYPGQPTPPPASDPFAAPPSRSDPAGDQPPSADQPKRPEDPA